MSRPLLCFLIFLAGLVAAQETAPETAQKTVEVRVTGETQGEIAPLAITGFNYGNFMRVAGYEEDFAALRVRSLRFPPGNQADEVSLDEAPINAFKIQWELLNEPHLVAVANLFQDGPAEAAHAARYFSSVGMPVQVWEIGNEPDLYATNRLDPSWTPEKYCERFRAFAAALNEINPAYLLAGPGVSGARPSGEVFLREVLRLCGDVIDVLTWHIYPTDGTWSDEAALATSGQVGEEIERYGRWLHDPQFNPLGYTRDIRLGITEFGLSWKTQNYHHLEDMIAALWLADTLGQMATGGLKLSHYFALQGTGGHGLIDNSGWLRPTYYVFDMLSSFSGQALGVTVSSPALHAYAAQQAGGVQVLLVNPSTESLRVRLSFGEEMSGEVTVSTLSEEIFDEMLSYRRESQNAGSTLEVPARAVVVVSAPGN